MATVIFTGLNGLAATVMGGIAIKRAKEEKERQDSRELIKEMACKIDGLCNTVATVTTDLAVVKSSVETVKSQNTELFQRVRATEQDAAIALDRTRNHEERKSR